VGMKEVRTILNCEAVGGKRVAKKRGEFIFIWRTVGASD